MQDENRIEDADDLPDGWKLIRIGDLCEVSTGTRDPRRDSEEQFQYVDISGVDNQTKRIIESRTIVGKDAPSRARQVIRENDVIVATTRPNLNAVASIPTNLDNQICSTGFCVLRAKGELDAQYLFAFVRSEYFVNALSALVKGAMYPAVTDKQVKSQFIPIPPTIEEQRRIASILDEQMKAVDQARTAIEKQLAAANHLPNAYLRSVFESEDATTWENYRFGDVCRFIGGSQPPASTFTRRPSDEHIRLVQIQDFRRSDLAVYIPKSEAKRTFDSSDVMIGRYGPPVFQILRGLEGAYNVALMKTAPNETKLRKDFLFYLLRWEKIQNAVIGQSQRSAGQSGVPKDFLEDMSIGLPPVTEQETLANHLEMQTQSIEPILQTLKAQLAATNKLPAALLRKAFSGQI